MENIRKERSSSNNPQVIIQLTSNHFLSSGTSYGSNPFAITPCRFNAVQLPLDTANDVLSQIKRDFPEFRQAQISYEVC